MSLKRGDIVMAYIPTPNSQELKLHPVVIISNEDVLEVEDIYLCVMMSSVEHNDKMSFVLSDKMLTKKNNKPHSEVRCHLISFIESKHLDTQPINSMNSISVDRLIERINEVCFNEE